MEDKNVRWKQRLTNFQKELNQLTDGIKITSINTPDIIKKGISQRFEFTPELAWNLMKDCLNTPYLFDISIFEKLNAADLEEHINRVGNFFYQKNNQHKS